MYIYQVIYISIDVFRSHLIFFLTKQRCYSLALQVVCLYSTLDAPGNVRRTFALLVIFYLFTFAVS